MTDVTLFSTALSCFISLGSKFVLLLVEPSKLIDIGFVIDVVVDVVVVVDAVLALAA